MTTFWLVPLAGFLGSFHCLAMCGPFVSFYSFRPSQHPSLRHLAYHTGRLMSYLAVGLIVGLLGQGLLYVGAYLQVQKLLMIALGLGMIAIGIRHYFPSKSAIPKSLGALHFRLTKIIEDPSKVGGTYLLGMFSTLLPCGFLYSFAFAAGASGSPVSSLGIMFGFWLGTLPMLLGVGLIARKFEQKAARYLQQLTPICLIIFGILAILGKWQAFPTTAMSPDQWCPVVP